MCRVYYSIPPVQHPRNNSFIFFKQLFTLTHLLYNKLIWIKFLHLWNPVTPYQLLWASYDLPHYCPFLTWVLQPDLQLRYILLIFFNPLMYHKVFSALDPLTAMSQYVSDLCGMSLLSSWCTYWQEAGQPAVGMSRNRCISLQITCHCFPVFFFCFLARFQSSLTLTSCCLWVSLTMLEY